MRIEKTWLQLDPTYKASNKEVKVISVTQLVSEFGQDIIEKRTFDYFPNSLKAFEARERMCESAGSYMVNFDGFKL